MASILEWPSEEALLMRHEKTSFNKNDYILVPAGKAVIISRGGDYSEIYREGDKPSLGSGLLRKPADLYLIDTQSSEAVSWGFGGIQCGKRTCGVNGSLKLKVTSPRKFLTSYASQDLPLTAEKLAALWIPKLGDLIRQQIIRLKSADVSDAEIPFQMSEKITEALTDPMEERGFQLVELTIEPLFFPDTEEEDE